MVWYWDRTGMALAWYCYSNCIGMVFDRYWSELLCIGTAVGFCWYWYRDGWYWQGIGIVFVLLRYGVGVVLLWYGITMVLVWYYRYWYGIGMVSVWYWYGIGMVLVWYWYCIGMVLVWYCYCYGVRFVLVWYIEWH